jgi:hypothetical protein
VACSVGVGVETQVETLPEHKPMDTLKSRRISNFTADYYHSKAVSTWLVLVYVPHGART